MAATRNSSHSIRSCSENLVEELHKRSAIFLMESNLMSYDLLPEILRDVMAPCKGRSEAHPRYSMRGHHVISEDAHTWPRTERDTCEDTPTDLSLSLHFPCCAVHHHHQAVTLSSSMHWQQDRNVPELSCEEFQKLFVEGARRRKRITSLIGRRVRRNIARIQLIFRKSQDKISYIDFDHYFGEEFSSDACKSFFSKLRVGETQVRN